MPLVDYDLQGASGVWTDDVARFVGKTNCLGGIEALTREHHGAGPLESLAVESAAKTRVNRRRAFGAAAAKLVPRAVFDASPTNSGGAGAPAE